MIVMPFSRASLLLPDLADDQKVAEDGGHRLKSLVVPVVKFLFNGVLYSGAK